MDDVITNKLTTIHKCLQRITTTYQTAGNQFATDFDRQDSVILNLQRACQACIDLANYTARKQQLGVPQSSRDSFQLLFKAQLLSEDVATKMKKMVGLRNIAVHDYQELNLEIIKHVIENHLQEFSEFANEIKAIYSQ
ncbi:MAG: hypothetical protein ACI8WB_004526 [Phenylobacterium sp.]|jgi:uncharacterized protein YutE (UPF0331/DUF86 family)